MGKKLVLTSLVVALTSLWNASLAFATTSSSVLVYSNHLYKIGVDLTTGKLPSALALIALGVGGIMHLLGKDQQVVHLIANVVMVLGVLVAAPAILSAFGLFSVTM